MPETNPEIDINTALPEYPVKQAFPDIARILQGGEMLALEAPTGSGKTTLLPPLMLGAGLIKKKILMTQPRRIAAKTTSARINQLIENCGGKQGQAGFRVRGESNISGSAKIEVVTEGYALAMLQADPFLSGYDWVIIDEFHERHIEGDLLTALLRDLRSSLGSDEAPGLIVMTATWQGQPRDAFQDFSFFSLEGRLFPVEKVFFNTQKSIEKTDQLLSRRLQPAVEQAVRQTDGKILVFLPGRKELDTALRILETTCPDFEINLLFGAMELKEQQRVLLYNGNRRQIILATAVAETSLTIEGVTAVVDSGLERLPVFQPAQAVTRLVTRRLSRATSDQRAGRAGRLGPGLYLRLWTEYEDRELVDRWDAEIITGDLSAARLQTAVWGSTELPWVTEPPQGRWKQAEALLRQLGALDDGGIPTEHGKLLARMPLPPRLAHMVAASADTGRAALAAAVISEGFHLFRNYGGGAARTFTEIIDRAASTPSAAGIRRTAADIEKRLKTGRGKTGPPAASAGGMLSLAYPDRIGRRGEAGVYTLSTGGRLECKGATAEWAVFPDVRGPADRLRAEVHEPVGLDELRTLHPEMLTLVRSTVYRPAKPDFRTSAVECFGRIELKQLPAGEASVGEKLAALGAAAVKRGIEILPLNRAAKRLLDKLETAVKIGVEGLPASDAETLINSMDQWLGPWLDAPLTAGVVYDALEARLDWAQRDRLEKLFPKEIVLRQGQKKAIDYSNPEKPLIRGRMQEFYGLDSVPAIAGGRIRPAVELLSPAMRPLQTTPDLGVFWKGSYAAVRSEMRGRYPKHYWPEDPATAEPSLATGKKRPD